MVEINPACAIELYNTFDHVLLQDMLEIQMQLKTPAEEREQEYNNIEFKKRLQELVDNKTEIQWGDITHDYESMLVYIQQSKTVEEKTIPPEIQTKILNGIELTPEDLAYLQ